eukprot:c24842_g1_i1 orf=177-1703(+)
METAVLPPQDCLHFQHYRLVPPFVDAIYPSGSAPRSRRELVRTSSVQSVKPIQPSESSCPDFEGSNPAANSFRPSGGLLASPDKTINARHISNSARSVMSTFSNPIHPSPLHSSPCKIRSDVVSSQNSLSCRMLKIQSSPSRSSSAGPSLNTVTQNDSYLGRRSAHSSTRRRPFKLVQGNVVPCRSGHRNDLSTPYFEEVAKFPNKIHRTVSRFDDPFCRNVKDRNFLNGCDITGNIQKRTHHDFLPTKYIGDQADFPISLRKSEDTKKHGMRPNSMRACVYQNNYAPKVQANALTILQRPKTTEAAQELLGRYEWETETLAPVKIHVNQTQDKEDLPFPGQGDNDALVSCPDTESIAQLLSSHGSKGNEPVCMRAVEQRTSMKDSPYGSDVYLEDPSGELTCNQVAVDENWAGPAYSISPPPSCLPLPKFSLKQLRTSSLEMSIVKEHCVNSGVWPGDPSVLPPSGSSCSQLTTIPICQPIFGGGKDQLDLAFATRDLRRMLNLDSR